MSLRVATRRSFERLAPYQAPVEGRAGKLRLDFNENTEGCPPGVLRALRRVTREQVAMYPEYQAATRRLARFFRVRPEELLLTNGVDDALRLMVDTFVEEGTRVLLAEPTFTMYRFYAALAGAQVLALRYDRAMRFPLDEALHVLRRGAAAPRLLFIANPNNPTGTLVAPGALERILKAASRTLVVVDEAYFEFSGVTVLPWIRRHERLVVLRTFSKAAGLAGLRLGCLFANRRLAGVLRTACSPFNVNSVALVAAEAVLGDPGFVRRYVRQVTRSRAELQKALERLGIRAYPSAANFVLADFGGRAPELLRGLERRGILLRDRPADLGRRGPVRITVGTRAQTRRLIRELEKLW